MGDFSHDFGPGGVRCPELRNILQGGRPGDPTFCIIYLGDDPQDWVDPQRLPPQVGLPLGGDATTSQYGGAVGVPSFGGGNGGSGTRVGGDTCPTPT